MNIRSLVIAAFLLIYPVVAQAQTCPTLAASPNFTFGGQVFGRLNSQWNSYFATKADANNGVLCNPQIAGVLNLSSANLTVASLTISGALTANGMGSSISNVTITGLPLPVNPYDAAPKVYVDQTIHPPAVISTGLTTALPANVYNNGTMGVGATLTATSNAALTVDGYAVNASDRILVAGEGSPANDGIYTVTNPGSGSAPYVLIRAKDFNQIVNITSGSTILVYGGATNSGSYDLTTSGAIVVGTTPLLFAKGATSSGAIVPLAPGALATTAALPANTYSNGAVGVGATLTATTNGALTVDSIAVTSAQRILVKNEATAANNGVYTVTNTGSVSAAYILTRTTDFDTSAQVLNDTYIFISGGTLNAKTGWILNSTGIPTIGTTAINFQQFSGATSYTAGTGLQLVGSQFSIPNNGITAGLLATGAAASNLGFTPLNPANNLGDLASAATGRINLGLGSLAVLNTLPAPQPSMLGGVFSFTQQTNQFLTALATNGTFTAAQPSFSNLAGSASVAQLSTALTTPPPIGTTTPAAVDASVLLVGTTNASNNYIANNIGSTTTTAQIVGLSTPGSGYGMLGGCELASGPATTDCFGEGGFALINGSSANQTGWALFGQSRHISTNGISLAAELNPINVSNTAPSPAYPYGIVGNYTSQPFVASNWSSCGDPSNFLPGQTIGDCSVAYGILNNAASPAVTGSSRVTGGAFLDGIVFSNDAIRGTTGADADASPVNAIGLGRMQGISFYNSGNTSANLPADRIYGATTSATLRGTNIRFDNLGTTVENAADGTWQFQVRPIAGATDYLFANGGTSSTPAGIGVTSARAAAGLVFGVQSSGLYSFYSGTTLDAFMGAGGLSVAVAGGLTLTPATWTDTQTCGAGQISVDANYIYVCTSANVTKRVALSAF